MRLLKLPLVLALAITGSWLGQAKVAANDDAAAKAQAVLAQARAALGGEAKLKALQSLSFSGKLRRVMGEREMGGEVTFDLLLPDKQMKVETIEPMHGIEITRTEVLNGAEVWVDNNSGGGGGNVMIRRAGDDSPKGKELANNAVRAEVTRLWLGALLTAPASANVSYSYVGEAEAPDGKADAIEIKGDNGFAARLFIDQKTHRPLMLTYLGRKARMVMSQGGSAPNPEEMEKRIKEAEAQAPVEFQMRFADYHEEGGISFPHHITKSVADEVTEEWELTKFKINPALKAEKFAQKK